MEVILIEDVAGLGSRGDVVRVKDGYARNYLFPRKLAIPDTPSNRKRFENEFKTRKKVELKKEEEARALADELSTLTLTIKAKAGEEGKLFGSITTKDIEEALKQKGYEIDRKHIHLEEHIKHTGVYDVPIKLFKEIQAVVKVWVVGEEGD